MFEGDFFKPQHSTIKEAKQHLGFAASPHRLYVFSYQIPSENKKILDITLYINVLSNHNSLIGQLSIETPCLSAYSWRAWCMLKSLGCY